MPDSEGISNTLREADIESTEVPGSSAEASPPSAAMRATPQASQPQVQQGQNLAEALEPFMPLANQFVENQSRQIELNHKIEGKRIDLEREEQRFRYNQFTKNFWLVAFISVSILAISAGIIFYLQQPDKGLLVLSHVGSVIAGILAGAVWQRSQQSGTRTVRASGSEEEA